MLNSKIPKDVTEKALFAGIEISQERIMNAIKSKEPSALLILQYEALQTLSFLAVIESREDSQGDSSKVPSLIFATIKMIEENLHMMTTQQWKLFKENKTSNS